MGKRRYVNLKELQTGMRIDQSIIDTTGRLLVARGMLLEGFHIAGLENLGISGVYITDDDNYSILEGDMIVSSHAAMMVERMTVKDKPAMALSEEVKKRVAEGMTYLFSNPYSENFVSAANTVSGDLMRAIIENNAVAVDVNALKISDEYTFKHSVDVASMAMIIARNMKMGSMDIREVGLAGLVHDLGKSRIPIDMLNKPGRLTEEEFAVMKKHPVFSYEMLKDKPGISKQVLMGVLQHHEKMGGTGYPLGIRGNGISVFARILSVVDIYDALVTERPYKAAFTPRDAVEMLLAMSRELDPDILHAFMNSVILYPVGTTLTLSNGEHVRVVENVSGQPMRPRVVELTSGKIYDLANDSACANLIIP